MSKDEKLKIAQEYALSRGGSCLSIEYKNNKEKMEWKCSHEDHPSWFSNFDNIVNKKSWCLSCSGKKAKSSEDGLKIAQEYAKSKGGKCLSNLYISRQKNLEWKCENNNHESWLATSDNVVHKGSWCPQCANEKQSIERKNPKGLEFCKDYAKSKGGECLESEYKNLTTKMRWKCNHPEHHEWLATARIIERSTWCPECEKK